MNTSLITGLESPSGITISGSQLYIGNSGNGTIGKYALDGTTVNASLVSGLTGLYGTKIPYGVAVSGNDLFVAAGSVAEYSTTSGAKIQSLDPLEFSAIGIGVSGSSLFILEIPVQVSFGGWTFDNSGGFSIDTLVLSHGDGLAVFGPDVFVTDPNNGLLDEYANAESTLTAGLVTGLGNDPEYVAVVPEPCATATYLLAGVAILLRRRRVR